MIRRTLLVLIVLVAALFVPAAASAASCGVTWGSLEKSEPSTNPNPGSLYSVRTGRHECFDRLVLEFRSRAEGFGVVYTEDLDPGAPGLPLHLRGAAHLLVGVVGSPEPFEHPAELVAVPGYRTFRQVSLVGSQQYSTQIGLGVRARLPFRVFSWGDKIVIDVAHAW
jgi:hypothetical protein